MKRGITHNAKGDFLSLPSGSSVETVAPSTTAKVTFVMTSTGLKAHIAESDPGGQFLLVPNAIVDVVSPGTTSNTLLKDNWSYRITSIDTSDASGSQQYGPASTNAWKLLDIDSPGINDRFELWSRSDASNQIVTVRWNVEIKNNATGAILSGTVSCSAHNSAVSGTGGGGGGGCVVVGSAIQTPAGDVLVEDLSVNDTINGRAFPSCPGADTSIPEDMDAVMAWSITELEGVADTNTISTADADMYTSYWKLNNTLKLTYDHPIFILRDGVYSWIQISDVMVGDIAFGEGDVEIPVTDIVECFGFVNVITLDVEASDTYYVEGYLVHNATQKF